MLLALEVGAVHGEVEFLDLTHGECEFRLEAARRRRVEDRAHQMRVAWHTAAWTSFSRRLPEWRDVYARLTGRPPEPKGVEEMAGIVRVLQSAFGGKLVTNPDYRPPAPAEEDASGR